MLAFFSLGEPIQGLFFSTFLAAQNEINNHFRLLDDLTTVLIQLYN
jgi:hypothetical protein